MEDMRNAYKILDNLNGEEHVEHQVIDGRIIFK
jgi:hypothetical protein